MRTSILSLLICLATAGSLFAGDITPEEAGKHVGEKVTVRGTVFQVFVSKAKNVYLNFGAKFPNQVFSADVLIEKTPALLADGTDWLTSLEGKEVAVTGAVELYKGKPEIVLKSREDLSTRRGNKCCGISRCRRAGWWDPPDPAYERTLRAAQGYFLLEMWEEAWNELENLAPEFRHYPQVIFLRLLIFNNMERWEYAVLLGKGAIQQYPKFGPLYLATAHALKNFEGAAAAKGLLVAGESLLKDEAIFHFMLGSYECQLGNLEVAKKELGRAFELNEELRLRALDESDLKPLWDSLGEP